MWNMQYKADLKSLILYMFWFVKRCSISRCKETLLFFSGSKIFAVTKYFFVWAGREGCLVMSSIRIGNGYDIHRLVAGRPLVLGGVEIPHSLGLLGNTDADVVIHAIIDAILGALSLGDIGHHYPPDDPKVIATHEPTRTILKLRFINKARVLLLLLCILWYYFY